MVVDSSCLKRDIIYLHEIHLILSAFRNLEKLDFFQKSIEDRLRMNIEYIDRWHEALGLFALPQNYPMSIKRLMNLMDDIMHYSGDRSSDVSLQHLVILNLYIDLKINRID